VLEAHAGLRLLHCSQVRFSPMQGGGMAIAHGMPGRYPSRMLKTHLAARMADTAGSDHTLVPTPDSHPIKSGAALGHCTDVSRTTRGASGDDSDELTTKGKIHDFS